ncbi:MAG: hypothetical protein A2Z96_06825 [Spirochaetes bacterium GWB1_48_6]|nr:MAG: hypothetical protein A2Z96_06825 [Spirochaetes bacterium GWB1_48_6]
MKQLIAGFLLTIGLGTQISALDMVVSQSVTNLYVNSASTSTNNKFTADDWLFTTNFSIKEEIAPGMSIMGGWNMDETTRKRLFTEVQYKSDVITLGVGPYFGIYNTSKTWIAPGLSTLFQLDLPGFGYINTAFQSTFIPLIQSGDYYQNMISFGSGLYLPNGIIGLNMEYKRFSEMLDTTVATDDLKAITASTEVFKKNFPLKFGADFRFQSSTREYSVEKLYYSIYSGIVVLKFNYEINPNFVLFLNSSSSILNFGYGGFTTSGNTRFAPPSNAYIFAVEIGSRIKI